jgi:hypothetical protein
MEIIVYLIQAISESGKREEGIKSSSLDSGNFLGAVNNILCTETFSMTNRKGEENDDPIERGVKPPSVPPYHHNYGKLGR